MIDNFNLFNSKLIEFANDLIYIFPNVEDFKIFKFACEWFVVVDKEYPERFFKYCMGDVYDDKIIQKDESFFLEESFTHIKYYGHDMNLISKLKKIWTNLDNTNKDCIWKYLNILMLISKRCNSVCLQDSEIDKQQLPKKMV